ncbi:hypothetical protein AB0O00_39525, partial [Kitasatospora sp. NPDC093558]
MRTPTPAARKAVLAAAGAAALAISGLATAVPAGAQADPAASAKGGTSWVRACDTLAKGDTVSCHALKVTNATQQVNAFGVTPNATPSGFGPGDLLSAYNLPANGGAGQTRGRWRPWRGRRP